MLQEPAVKRLRTFKELLDILEAEFFKGDGDSKVILYFLYRDIIMRSWEYAGKERL